MSCSLVDVYSALAFCFIVYPAGYSTLVSMVSKNNGTLSFNPTEWNTIFLKLYVYASVLVELAWMKVGYLVILLLLRVFSNCVFVITAG